MSEDDQELLQQDHFLCGCGYRFEEALGLYGCPNCEGDHADQAELVEARDRRDSKILVITGAGSWRPVSRALIESMAKNGVGRVERVSFVQSPLVTDRVPVSRGKGKKRKPWESEYP